MRFRFIFWNIFIISIAAVLIYKTGVFALNPPSGNPPPSANEARGAFIAGNGTYSGNFGISTTNPQSKLNIVGDLRVEQQRQSIVVNTGRGSDGSITVSSAVNLNTTNLIAGRSCAQGGDAVNYAVNTLTANTAEVSPTPASTCLVAGDEVLMINIQGTHNSIVNVGNYETMRVSAIAGDIITFAENKTKFYGDGASNDSNIGGPSTHQRVIIQRVPNYTNVTVQSGGSITVSSWNRGIGVGGILFFRANGTLTNNGTISANGLGYHGGQSGYLSPTEPFPGEGRTGLGVVVPYGNFGPRNDIGGAGSNWIGSGAGGGNGAAGGNGAGTIGGIATGLLNRNKIIFGGGGGGSHGSSGTLHRGGRGGGVISVFAKTIIITGSFVNSGTSPGGCTTGATTYGPGGGAGGSILFVGEGITFAAGSTINAAGAVGATCAYSGGSGGNGNVEIIYQNTNGYINNGSANPVPTANQLSTLGLTPATHSTIVQYLPTTTPLLVVNTAGNIGIGTANFTERLTVIGNTQISGSAVMSGLQLTGIPLQAEYGGTGIVNVGAPGNILRSTGLAWESVPIKPLVVRSNAQVAVGITASCNTGESIVGGGCQGWSGSCWLEHAGPSGNGWYCYWVDQRFSFGYCLESGPSAHRNTAYAICR